ncbi:hypothetical protein GNI_050150 [Gregarina niphandrodes]|uniref:Uncharacterized protein n=1 Tax=Gregarina niphandrodes TaxID=110365 RepID=A0A023B9K3_GRENI|nr:hypothetical protein GNI_050150 [Gregarina niphandrodes]EZG72965.1 hypothetical protein GNI_050150 [Gregarina niphandrodes]|eukprot:XP_011129724.1 hypothetical protein GNI_050150 [Gregarina niphandrodes]
MRVLSVLVPIAVVAQDLQKCQYFFSVAKDKLAIPSNSEWCVSQCAVQKPYCPVNMPAITCVKIRLSECRLIDDDDDDDEHPDIEKCEMFYSMAKDKLPDPSKSEYCQDQCTEQICPKNMPAVDCVKIKVPECQLLEEEDAGTPSASATTTPPAATTAVTLPATIAALTGVNLDIKKCETFYDARKDKLADPAKSGFCQEQCTQQKTNCPTKMPAIDCVKIRVPDCRLLNGEATPLLSFLQPRRWLQLLQQLPLFLQPRRL